MEEGPFFHEIAGSPGRVEARWVQTADGKVIRIAFWPQAHARGTVLIFPGRTEYVEKYAGTAAELARRGFASLAVDWRGQGLSERLTRRPIAGHVPRFTDYQFDVLAVAEAASVLELPAPLYLLAHSMGGAIGLRAVIEGLPVAAAVFSAPMWGIRIPKTLRPVAWGLSWSSRAVGLSHRIAPGTSTEMYYEFTDFERNELTSDREMWEWMQSQTRAVPALRLGGPSLHWLSEALRECRALGRMPSPPIPAIATVGEHETIVDAEPIRARMSSWPAGRLIEYPGVRHEIMMEGPRTRDAFYDTVTELFRSFRS